MNYYPSTQCPNNTFGWNWLDNIGSAITPSIRHVVVAWVDKTLIWSTITTITIDHEPILRSNCRKLGLWMSRKLPAHRSCWPHCRLTQLVTECEVLSVRFPVDNPYERSNLTTITFSATEYRLLTESPTTVTIGWIISQPNAFHTSARVLYLAPDCLRSINLTLKCRITIMLSFHSGRVLFR